MTVLVALDSDPTALVLLLFDVVFSCVGAGMVQAGASPCCAFLFPSFLIAFQVGLYLGNALFFFASLFLLLLGGLCLRSGVASCVLCWHWNFVARASPQQGSGAANNAARACVEGGRVGGRTPDLQRRTEELAAAMI